MSAPTAAPPSPPPPRRKGRRLGLRILLTLLLLVVLGVACWNWIALSYVYASGQRTGYIRELTHTGWLCKTWEGELSLVALPGAAPEKFLFTVRDDAVAARINAAVGKRVALNYEQHKGLPGSCFGETDYFVTDIKLVE